MEHIWFFFKVILAMVLIVAWLMSGIVAVNHRREWVGWTWIIVQLLLIAVIMTIIHAHQQP